MNRIVDHCLDTTTIGGRTLSDVPLLGSASVVEDVETELLSGLKLRPLDIEDVYPVTPLQSGLLTAMISDPAEYVLQSVFDIRGDFDFERLETCWKSLALETPLLRTVFVSTVHGLFQAVTNEDLSEWIMLPATWLSDEIDTLTKEYLDNDRQRGFTLMSKSYHRFAAARISDGRIRVFWTHHHSLMDGWSLQLVMDKLLSICYGEEYNATFVPFKDHIEWLAQQDEEPSRLFWESALANSDQSQQLALPKPHLDGQTSQTKYKALALTVPLPGMTSVCRKLGVTPSSVFRAAWSIVLQQYTRSEYVTFGSVVSGRDTGLDGVDKIIGMLINTVPIQVHVSTGGLTDDLIVDVHRLSTDIVQYSHCSLVDVKRWAKVAPEGQLFDTILVYENYPPSEMDKSKLRPFTLEVQSDKEFVDCPLCVVIESKDDAFTFGFKYIARDIDENIVDFIGERFVNVAKELTKPSAITISFLDTPMDVENSLLLNSSSGPVLPVPYALLHHACENQAKLNPNLRALEYEEEFLSYGDLNSHADNLACQLSAVGARIGTRVAIIMSRCLEFPVSLLATLKVGGVIMAMDASFPAQRLSFMLLDSNASVVISTEKHRAKICDMNLGIPVIFVSNEQLQSSNQVFQPSAENKATVNDEAFVVYTSGSTGKPKGVPVLHGGAVNIITHSAMEADIKEGVRVMQFMAIGFDACQWETWKTLSNGAILVIRSDDLTSLSKVNVLMCTPTGLSLFGHPSDYPNLKCVCVAGESVPHHLKELWAPYVCFMNVYGPTECSISTHFVKLDMGDAITVGSPVPNVTSYVLDKFHQQVPVGVVGEMYLGGVCVSSGYINLPEQNIERFVPNPFSANTSRMFRTGDLCRLLPSGQFEILGRLDSQVKLKGYRIELEEVAEAMTQHPGITTAAVIVKDNCYLVGYFTPANVNVHELERSVADHLPTYMVPSVWVGLEAMPLNTNGKIDKIVLQELDVAHEVQVLQSEAEHKMAEVWSEVLNVALSVIGRRTSFLALGGDSITAIRLVAKAKQMGFSLTSAAVMKHTTLEAMTHIAKHIHVQDTSECYAVVSGD
ncbi:hypothetical protein As57867_004980, partial [Aphanomyces stellatus]